jgi:hypothetical protein
MKFLTATTGVGAVSTANYKTPSTGNVNVGYWFCAGSVVTTAPVVNTNPAGTAANSYIACKNADNTKNTYVVDLQVEMLDKPCCDPMAHPKPSDSSTNTIYNLLKENQVGCGTVTGVDTNLARLVASDSFAAFTASNTKTMNSANMGTKLFAFYTTANTAMKLYTRDKIMVKCTAACQQF